MTNLTNGQIVILMVLALVAGFGIALNVKFGIAYVKDYKIRRQDNWHNQEHEILYQRLYELLTDFSYVHNLSYHDVLQLPIAEVHKWAIDNASGINHYHPHPTFTRDEETQ